MQDTSSEPPKTDKPADDPTNLDISPDVSDTVTPVPLEQPQPVVVKSRSHKVLWTIIIMLALLLLGAIGYGVWRSHHHTKAQPIDSGIDPNQHYGSTVRLPEGLKLDVGKNYGNKYADGILPVGDGKYVTDAPKTGYVYTCSQYAHNLANDQGGADTRGPWFMNSNTQYDINKKAHVAGNVTWTADFSNTVSGSTRTIVTNDLPSHPTGVFPIQTSDPAHAYDRNPNSIKGQTLTYALAASPTYSETPNCMGGEVGVMLTGVALFNAFDAGGRDAGAWEVQDGCSGHPQSAGEYHYHTLSSCINDVREDTIIGYALDGFPITGPKVGTNAVNGYLTTADLDECHGIVSTIKAGSETAIMYHYVMTQDFPYSVSCFRGTPITPPGMQQQPAGHP